MTDPSPPRCADCGESDPKKFQKRKASPNGRQAKCAKCNALAGAKWRKVRPGGLQRQIPQICILCGDKDPKKFSLGKRDLCIACTGDSTRLYAWKKSGIQGMTPAVWGDLMNKQRGRCFLSHKTSAEAQPKTNKALAVDHDHATGKVRTLLCAPCNRFVGRVEKDPELTMRVLDYLALFRSGYSFVDQRLPPPP
jgi:hypothetical protein